MGGPKKPGTAVTLRSTVRVHRNTSSVEYWLVLYVDIEAGMG